MDFKCPVYLFADANSCSVSNLPGAVCKEPNAYQDGVVKMKSQSKHSFQQNYYHSDQQYPRKAGNDKTELTLL